MKPPVDKFKAALKAEAERARESFAAVELKPDLVRVKLYDAAKLGEQSLRLKLPDGCSIDMRGTKAAQELEAWARGAGLLFTWESRVVETPDGRRRTLYEPEITWGEVVRF